MLMVRPDTPEELIDEILKRHYRILAMKYHTDRGGDNTKMAALNAAYEVLNWRLNAGQTPAKRYE